MKGIDFRGCSTNSAISSSWSAGIGEEVFEEAVTVSTLYIAPKAEPTKDSTKDFTPRVETATPREDLPMQTPRKPVRTEVREQNNQPIHQTGPLS